MARYIDADKLYELVENRQGRGDCKFCNKYERCVKNGINRKGSHLYCWEEIELPTADVVEVKRGKWILNERDRQRFGKVSEPEDYEHYCSCCNEEALCNYGDDSGSWWYLSDYCPKCGAKMGGAEQ